VKQLAVIVLTVFVVLASASAASAAASPDKRIAALEKRVTALDKRVKALEKQNKTLTNIVDLLGALDVCTWATTADVFASTWNVIDQIAQGTQGKTYFGTQTDVNDLNACSAFEITRQHGVPPTVAIFSSLVRIFAPQ
jgi:hypothetical protein